MPNLIAALGTGATAVAVLWMFVAYSREEGRRQDAQTVQTRNQLLDVARENRDKLETLLRRQSEVMQANADAMQRLSLAVERANMLNGLRNPAKSQ